MSKLSRCVMAAAISWPAQLELPSDVTVDKNKVNEYKNGGSYQLTCPAGAPLWRHCVHNKVSEYKHGGSYQLTRPAGAPLWRHCVQK
jgi:hypothetical protein